RRRVRLPGQAALAVRRRPYGQTRRHDRALDAGPSAGEQGHLKNVGEPNVGISGLRDRSEVERGVQRRSVPHLYIRGATQVRVLSPDDVRARYKLELRAHQL